MESVETLEQNDSGGLTTMVWNLLSLPTRVMQHLLPSLLPVFVCLLCIPFLMFFSGAAGWIVWRNVPVNWIAEAFLQYGEESVPFANVVLPSILKDQPYDVSLQLVVPTTDSNYALGNFMATLKLTTAYNDSIITVRRPAALAPPRSSLAKQIFLGAPATVKLDIPLLSQFVSGTNSVNARLEVGRSDSWKAIGNGQGRELSVVGAALIGRVRPKGIIAILARYPRLTTFASIFTFFFVSLLIVCFLLFMKIRPPSTHPLLQKGNGSEDEDNDDESSGSHPVHKRYIRQEADRRDIASSPITPGDTRPEFSGNRSRTSSLRKRRSSPAVEPLTSTHIKIEDIPIRRGTTPPSFPKSPYPRPPSIGSDPGLYRHGAMVEPTSPSDADAESP